MRIKLTLISLLITTFLSAQDTEESGGYDGYVSPENRAYSPGNLYINGGVNFFYGRLAPRAVSWWAGYEYSSTPPLLLSAEFGFDEQFSIGGFLGYRRYGWSYRDGLNRDYDYNYNMTAFGVRGSFHYVPLANEHFDIGLEEDHFDFYVTLFMGFRLTSESITRPDLRETNTDVRFILGPVLGFRYMFNDTFGAYIEGGRGSLGYGNLGLTIKI